MEADDRTVVGHCLIERVRSNWNVLIMCVDGNAEFLVGCASLDHAMATAVEVNTDIAEARRRKAT